MENLDVIANSMDQMLCGDKHPLVCDAMYVVVGDAIQTVIRLENCHRVLAPRDLSLIHI